MPSAVQFPGSLPSGSARLSVFLVLLAGLVVPAGALAQCDFEYFLTATAPSTVSAGVPFYITVTVLDSCGQVGTGYTTYVEFSSSDPSSVFPPGMNLITTGVGTYQATLQTPGAQSITATGPVDVCSDFLPCPSVGINVLPATEVFGQSSVNFGSLAIGSTSEAQPVSFTISPGITVGSIAVLTQGAPGMDFTEAAGSTCAATTYSPFSTTSCTVNVTFTPKAAGLRMGAVVFFAGAGNTGAQLASVPIYGVGIGPQIAYGPGTATAVGPVLNGATLSSPMGVAVDGLGDLFIMDQGSGNVVEALAGGGVSTTIAPTLDGWWLDSSSGLAVDGAGDLFIANPLFLSCCDSPYNGYRVVEAPAGGGLAKAVVPVANGESLSGPTDVAVDGAGDLFIADNGNNRVVEAPTGGSAAIAIAPKVNELGLNGPYGVAVDGAGDLFITDTNNNRVVEVPAGGEEPIAVAPTVGGIALNSPEGIAVDTAGDLFIADTNNNRVVEVPAGGAAIGLSPVVNGLGLNGPVGIAVDGSGDLFIADSNNNRVIKIERSQAPTVNFPTPTPVGSIDTTDGTQTVEIQNIGNEALDFTGLGYPVDFPEVLGDAGACTRSISLSAGQECDLPIQFAPERIGFPLSEDVTLIDNALHVNGARQSIVVTGSTPAPYALTTPAPGSVLQGPKVTFAWTPAPGATGYSLWVGTTGVGSNNLFDSGETTATSRIVGDLPTNGETVYVRLYAALGKVTAHIDSTFQASTLAAVTSPQDEGIVSGTSVIFNWSAAAGATGYSLWVGSTGFGSNDLYDSGETTATTATVKKLPPVTETIYSRLYTSYGNFVVYNDSSYLLEGGAADQGVSSRIPPGGGRAIGLR